MKRRIAKKAVEVLSYEKVIKQLLGNSFMKTPTTNYTTGQELLRKAVTREKEASRYYWRAISQ
jgi:hypothetical protein